MDIGKSIAVFIVAAAVLQLAECGWAITNRDFSVEGVLQVLQVVVVTAVGTYLAIRFWCHDDQVRRWTIALCKIAYVLFPLIFLFGFLSGRPLSINIPFFHTKTDSLVVIMALLVGGLIYFAVVHLLLASHKAVAEFTRRTDSVAG
jgi:hypothetical protein